MLFLLGVVTLFASCSKDGDGEDLKNASHKLAVYNFGINLFRFTDSKVFISETPFSTWSKFSPLKSLNLKADRTQKDSLVFNVSEYVGKTLYVVTLRKKLLSDDYYSITPTLDKQSISSLKVQITEGKPNYQIGIINSEPANGTYTPDVAKLVLRVRKGTSAVADRSVYYYGTSQLWSEAIIKNIEQQVALNGKPVQKYMNKTDGAGISRIDIPINERGTVTVGGKTTKYNEHVFFVLEAGKVKFALVDANALKLDKTIAF